MPKRNEFSRRQRLITKAEFKTVFDQAQKVAQKHLVVLFKPNKQHHARLGVIVGKRVANLAVTRNKIKRVLRESFRANKDKLKGLDIIVIARSQCDTLAKPKLREGIERLWERLISQSQSL